MKVAIIHDVFVESGGAERVLAQFIKLYPTADLYIPLLTDQNRQWLQTQTRGQIYTAWFNNLPLVHSASILLKPMLFWYWQSLQLQAYQLVISSSHSFSSKGVLTSPDTLHVSYVHTPPRYLYTEFSETRILHRPFWRGVLQPLLGWLRQQDWLAGQRPDVLVANSHTVQQRIQKYYRRASQIIYPPVQVSAQPSRKNKKLYYLCHSRLAKQKGIDLAILACNQLKAKLIVIGTGGEAERLRQLAGPTVSFVGRVSDEQLGQFYARAKALLYCSLEEDFGMVTVEAMGYGVPVIGHWSGGTREILSPKTGVGFADYTVAGLVTAIRKFEAKKWSALACQRRAQKFSAAQFTKAWKKCLARSWRYLDRLAVRPV